MIYTSRVAQWQTNTLYGFSVFFFICAFFSYFQSPVTSLWFIAGGLAGAAYSAYTAQSWVKFDPNEPSLQIKNGLAKAVIILPQDCVRLTVTIGRTTSPKLVYRVSDRQKSIAMYSTDREVDKAWTQYAHKWLNFN